MQQIHNYLYCSNTWCRIQKNYIQYIINLHWTKVHHVEQKTISLERGMRCSVLSWLKTIWTISTYSMVIVVRSYLSMVSLLLNYSSTCGAIDNISRIWHALFCFILNQIHMEVSTYSIVIVVRSYISTVSSDDLRYDVMWGNIIQITVT